MQHLLRHLTITTFTFFIFLFPKVYAEGNESYPYRCTPAATTAEGWILVYSNHGCCSKRQSPEALEACKNRIIDGDGPFYERIETPLHGRCYNDNGTLSASWCMENNTWDQGTGVNAYWCFQSSKNFQCNFN